MYMVGVGPKDQGLWISPYSFNMAKPQQNMFALAAASRLPHSLNSPHQTKGNTRHAFEGFCWEKVSQALAGAWFLPWDIESPKPGQRHVLHVRHVLKTGTSRFLYQIHPKTAKTFWNALAWGLHPFPRILKPSKLHIHKRAAWDRVQNEAKWQIYNRIWYVCITLSKGISLYLFSWVMLCLTLNLTPPHRLIKTGLHENTDLYTIIKRRTFVCLMASHEGRMPMVAVLLCLKFWLQWTGQWTVTALLPDCFHKSLRK